MDFSFKIVLLIITIALTGLSAGLCFTWANAVTPGIGRLTDHEYLTSFQAMNRAILNPTFFMVFLGPVVVQIATMILYRNAGKEVFLLMLIAGILYFGGVVLVTIFGNVPLNEILDKTDLLSATPEELSSLRDQFETRWNRLHLVRTLTAILSFVLLLISQASHSNF